MLSLVGTIDSSPGEIESRVLTSAYDKGIISPEENISLRFCSDDPLKNLVIGTVYPLLGGNKYGYCMRDLLKKIKKETKGLENFRILSMFPMHECVARNFSNSKLFDSVLIGNRSEPKNPLIEELSLPCWCYSCGVNRN